MGVVTSVGILFQQKFLASGGFFLYIKLLSKGQMLVVIAKRQNQSQWRLNWTHRIWPRFEGS
jgi:hypothetical protein